MRATTDPRRASPPGEPRVAGVRAGRRRGWPWLLLIAPALVVGLWLARRDPAQAQEGQASASSAAPAGVAAAGGTAGDGTAGASSVTEPQTEAEAEEQAWEYDPYHIRVWVAMSEGGSLTPQLLEDFSREFPARARILAGATWKVSVSAPPSEALRRDLVRDIEALSPDELFTLAHDAAAPESAAVHEALAHDKLMLVTIHEDALGFDVACRELDTATRQLSQVARRRVGQRDALEPVAFDALAETFRALVLITEVKDRDVKAIVRAGGLVVDDFCPSRVAADGVLVPVIRSNDRLGQPKDIKLAEWSYIVVQGIEGELLTGRLYTGLKGPLSGRASSRVQKYGLQITPRHATSRLRLVSRGEDQEPMSGYEVWDRHPEDENDSTLLGQTDWNGELEVPRGGTPLRWLYIKNGNQMLSKFPTVPGYLPEMQAEMYDDEGRLLAEAFIRAVQQNVLDTVAQRQLLTASASDLMTKGKQQEVQELLIKIQALGRMSELNALLDRRKREMNATNARMQAQIDAMFSGVKELIAKYLSENATEELRTKIRAAGGGGAAPAPEAPPPAAPAPAPAPAPMPTTPATTPPAA